MNKVGAVFIAAFAALANGGAPGLTDSPVVVSADNGATVEPIDATSSRVTLTQAGVTTVVAKATVDGAELSSNAVTEEAGDPATSITLTLTAE